MMESRPVNVLYDPDKVDENSNIEPMLVVPIGHCRSRSDNSHRIGQRLYKLLEAANPKDPRLRILAIENPKEQGSNHIDSIVQSVLRLSRGIRGFGSIQATDALRAPGGPGPSQGMVPSLQGTNPQAPQTTIQIGVQAGKEAGAPLRPIAKKWIGLNGR